MSLAPVSFVIPCTFCRSLIRQESNLCYFSTEKAAYPLHTQCVPFYRVSLFSKKIWAQKTPWDKGMQSSVKMIQSINEVSKDRVSLSPKERGIAVLDALKERDIMLVIHLFKSGKIETEFLSKIFSSAIEIGHLEAIQWVFANGTIPLEEIEQGIVCAIQNGHHLVAHWMLSKYKVSVEGRKRIILLSVGKSNSLLINLLLSTPIDQATFSEASKLALEQKDPTIIQFLRKYAKIS